MARTKKAAQRAPKAQEAPEAPEAAEAPPAKKSRKNKKEAARKGDEQPSPKQRRSSEEEEAVQKDEAEPAAEVATLKASPAKSDSPLLVFAHGAGAPSSHEWMVRYAWLRVRCLSSNTSLLTSAHFAVQLVSEQGKGVCKGLGFMISVSTLWPNQDTVFAILKASASQRKNIGLNQRHLSRGAKNRESMLNVDRWKKLLGEATGAVEVVTFDYPCKRLL
jgi:hypothetical protein